MKHENYHRDPGYVMRFRPSNDWQRRHRRLIDFVNHAFFAFDELDSLHRDRLMTLFFDACQDCGCPDDIDEAVFNVLTGRDTLTSACSKYYYCRDSLCRWRRRVILSVARKLISDAAVRHDV